MKGRLSTWASTSATRNDVIAALQEQARAARRVRALRDAIEKVLDTG